MRAGENHRPGVLLAVLCVFIFAVAARASDDEQVFKLREASAFQDSDFARGQISPCPDKPYSEVKHYPSFTSTKPLFGSVRLDSTEMGRNSGRQFYFAIDESRGTGKGYDRFYFDLNGDLDLRNDAALKPLEKKAGGAELRWSNIKQQVCFDYLSLNYDCGPAGEQTLQIMPRLLCCKYEEQEYQQVCFVRTKLYEGTIAMGKRDYGVRLGNDYVIAGRLDSPVTAVRLTPMGGGNDRVSWWGGDRLSGVHKVGDQYFTLAASPKGDQLTVRRYKGELGTFEVGLGGRKVETISVNGSLRSTNMAVAVGGPMGSGWPEPVRSCRVPVGDFLPTYLTIQLGKLRINVSDNYHSDGKAMERGDRPYVYGITIRPDRPFVLDFANRPDVMFASPAKDQRLKPGDSLEVKAVLVDPKLDMMIRGLDDTSRKQSKSSDGKALGYERDLPLDPKVVISRMNGEKVAEGVMPFG